MAPILRGFYVPNIMFWQYFNNLLNFRNAKTDKLILKRMNNKADNNFTKSGSRFIDTLDD